jgi:predicted CXXCH cytochrome family protein
VIQSEIAVKAKLTAFAVLFSVATLGAAASEDTPSSIAHSVDQELCLDCHDLSAELGAAVKHAPAASRECSACHNPHVARFSGLLRERPAALCENCHQATTGSNTHANVHRPVAEGRCSACHNPHGSPNRGLLTEKPVALCGSCHAEVTAWKDRKVQHSPFAQGSCATCHEPHASDNQGLLNASGARVCTSCHSADETFRRVHSGYPVDRAPCQKCHDPHASSRRGLFRETVHAPFEDGDCATCHAGAGAADPFATIKPENELCADCHQRQVLDSKRASFPHVSAGGGRCTSCHNPHAGEGAGMMRKGTNATCLSCHDPGGGRSGQEHRFSTHAEDIECVACHSPHGSENPLLFPDKQEEVCGSCHAHQHVTRHPQGEGVLDPRSGNPMDCDSCHGIHFAPNAKYLHGAPEGELCLGCHRDIGGGGL